VKDLRQSEHFRSIRAYVQADSTIHASAVKLKTLLEADAALVRQLESLHSALATLKLQKRHLGEELSTARGQLFKSRDERATLEKELQQIVALIRQTKPDLDLPHSIT
jgi:hypothetical protein